MVIRYTGDYRSRGRVHTQRTGKTKVKGQNRNGALKQDASGAWVPAKVAPKRRSEFFDRTEARMLERDKGAGLEQMDKTRRQVEKQKETKAREDAAKKQKMQQMSAIAKQVGKDMAQGGDKKARLAAAHSKGSRLTAAYAATQGQREGTPGRAQELLKNRGALPTPPTNYYD